MYIENVVNESLLALDPTFIAAVGAMDDAAPYTCYIECLKQNIIQVGKPLTIGLTQGNLCLCGLEPSKKITPTIYAIFVGTHIRE